MAADEGRACPVHYRYRPERLCERTETVTDDVLYVIGGLYGNPFALDEIESMARRERASGRSVRLVFNGDFNWFNASDSLFREINQRVLRHTASLGNVEYELAHPSAGAGCGCAYPDFVDQGVVERSNAIMLQLQTVAANHPDIQQSLAELPRWRCLMFGGLKVLVLHGDPESLAGWGLAHESFQAGNHEAVARWFRQTGADILVCSHTCLPLIWQGEVDGRSRLVINNGSAGMGNLQGDPRGLLARIARTPAGGAVAQQALLPLHCALQPVAFDLQAWLADFDRLWPAGSDAAVSYRDRLLGGTTLIPSALIF